MRRHKWTSQEEFEILLRGLKGEILVPEFYSRILQMRRKQTAQTEWREITCAAHDGSAARIQMFRWFLISRNSPIVARSEPMKLTTNFLVPLARLL
jgi:hypothetical protein